MSKTRLRHTLINQYFLHFCRLPYFYTFSLYENASFIIVSAETCQLSNELIHLNLECRHLIEAGLKWIKINSYLPFVCVDIRAFNVKLVLLLIDYIVKLYLYMTQSCLNNSWGHWLSSIKQMLCIWQLLCHEK